MHTNHSRTAKSARRKFTLTLLGALAVLAAASIAVYAAIDASSPPRFYLEASPSSQTVAAGQTANYAIELDRQNHFIEPVALSVSNLPANTNVDYYPGPIPGSSSRSTITIETNAGGTTPEGTRTLTITGTGGGVTSTDTVTLTVLPASAKNFTLNARPSAQVVTENDSASYSIGISRTSNFNATVAFTASGLPNGASASFTPNPASSSTTSTSLVITTNGSVKPGRYTVIVEGLGTSGATELTRYTSLSLIVEEKKPFLVTGDPADGLAPGDKQPIDLALTNSQHFDIYVREVMVAFDPYSSAPGCSVKSNFAVEQIPAGKYPIVLPADSTRTLSQLGFSEDDMPAVQMHNLATNQDACKAADISFQYSGVATKP